MVRTVRFAPLQFACSWDQAATLDTAEALVRAAAGGGVRDLPGVQAERVKTECAICHFFY